MNEGTGGFSCALGCWALAAGVGVLAFVLMMVLGETRFFAAIFLSGAAVGVLGLLFQAVFCRDLPEARGAGAGPAKRTGLRAHPPEDPADASVSFAHARREAEAAGRMPPESPADLNRPTGATIPSAPVQITEGPEPNAADLAEGKAASGTTDAPKTEKASREPARPVPPSDPVPAGTPAPGAASGSVGSEPERLDAPRGGAADDLKKIKGVGPKLEQQLNAMGFYHFDQIAGWSADEVAWVDENLEGFRGRVSRDDWVAQARTLAADG
jgi:predicted flap endonuclease-1-like 5' DNA nuclease